VEVPRGTLVRSRVVSDLAVTFESVLDEALTGYLVLEPQDALLLDGETRAVLTIEDGVPTLAYDPASDADGEAALTDLASPGPYRVEVYELDAAALAEAHDAPEAAELRVPPALPVERLAGDERLAARTREAAPDDRADAAAADPVEAFLADGETIDRIREEARAEARERAAEWGLDDQLVDGEGDGEVGAPGQPTDAPGATPEEEPFGPGDAVPPEQRDGDD